MFLILNPITSNQHYPSISNSLDLIHLFQSNTNSVVVVDNVLIENDINLRTILFSNEFLNNLNVHYTSTTQQSNLLSFHLHLFSNCISYH